MVRQVAHSRAVAFMQPGVDFAGVNDTPENRSALGRRIAEARSAAGYMNKSEFARLVGIQGPTLHRWEKGQIAPEIWNLHEVARLTHVSMEWLMSGALVENRQVLEQWLIGRTITPEARSFLEGLSLSGYEPSPAFYDLAYVAWQHGLSPAEATRAARVTDVHRPR
jgi:DNA-binding XRE family transcriptional regulator